MYAKNTWNKYKDNQYKDVMEFNEGYKHFISVGKTERACVKESVRLAKEYGFKNISEYSSLTSGDKVYVVNRDKTIALFVMGKRPLNEGLHILGAHIDSPRIDVKQNPLYESDGFALLDTHYYGGIKNYQWVTIPLSLVGVVIKKDGTTVQICIGEDENDPVVGITDLLIHLAADQMQKTASKVISGEALDINVGSIPLEEEEKDNVKANILRLLKEKYDIEEEDFLSAEIEVVPAGKARDFGLDRSMVLGYGHDDRVCAYTSLMATLEMTDVEYTSCCFLVDKEEIGSVGATGAHSLFFENTVAELLHLCGDDSYLSLKRAISNSMMLSSDVSAGFDPLYKEVNDPKNAAYLGKGIVFNKYTGTRGKGGSNDANPEYIARLRQILDEAQIHFQTAELGKVDQGGGGTIAYIFANQNMDVIDAGIAVLNMHAPYELVSKVDVYEGYLAYKIFLQNA